MESTFTAEKDETILPCIVTTPPSKVYLHPLEVALAKLEFIKYGWRIVEPPTETEQENAPK